MGKLKQIVRFFTMRPVPLFVLTSLSVDGDTVSESVVAVTFDADHAAAHAAKSVANGFRLGSVRVAR